MVQEEQEHKQTKLHNYSLHIMYTSIIMLNQSTRASAVRASETPRIFLIDVYLLAKN